MLSKIWMPGLFVFVLAASAFAGDSAPAWLQQVAAVKVPTYEKNIKAVVLDDEKSVSLDGNGGARNNRKICCSDIDS